MQQQCKQHVSTIVISDVHIGSSHAKINELTLFLKETRCDKLILNGDILDGWKLQRNPLGRWRTSYTKLIKVVMKKMSRDNTEVIYVRGNHDDFLDKIIPLQFSTIRFVKEYVHETHGKRYYVAHGDIFDNISTNMIWLAKLGDIGYSLLLWINNMINKRRQRAGKSYYSFAQSVKHRVKSAVSYISDFEKELSQLASDRKFDGVICGHIHQPANTYYGNVHYLNSGDWVESLSALIEHENGEWEVYRFKESLQTVDTEIESWQNLKEA